jgi:hypothetical protein
VSGTMKYPCLCRRDFSSGEIDQKQNYVHNGTGMDIWTVEKLNFWEKRIHSFFISAVSVIIRIKRNLNVFMLIFIFFSRWKIVSKTQWKRDLNGQKLYINDKGDVNRSFMGIAEFFFGDKG